MGPARFHCATLLYNTYHEGIYHQIYLVFADDILKSLSEVGFEPTPTEVDCDLNAAP